jgi:hypothetical protein
MPEYDFPERLARMREVARKLLRVFASLIERKPEPFSIPILTFHPREIDRTPIDPRRCAGLEACCGQAELFDLLGDLGSRGLTSSSRRNLGIEPQVNPTS